MKAKMDHEILTFVIYMVILTTVISEEPCKRRGGSTCSCTTNVDGEVIVFQLDDKLWAVPISFFAMTNRCHVTHLAAVQISIGDPSLDPVFLARGSDLVKVIHSSEKRRGATFDSLFCTWNALSCQNIPGNLQNKSSISYHSSSATVMAPKMKDLLHSCHRHSTITHINNLSNGGRTKN